MRWVPGIPAQGVRQEKKLPPLSQGPWRESPNPSVQSLVVLSWDEDPIVLTAEEGVSLKSGSTLYRCLFICIVKMNLVSSQNSKTASVPLLTQSLLSSYRASRLLRRERNHGLGSRLQRDHSAFSVKCGARLDLCT